MNNPIANEGSIKYCGKKDRYWIITKHHEARNVPDSKVHMANMGPTWGRQDPGGFHVGPINLAIKGMYISRDISYMTITAIMWLHRCQYVIYVQML